MIDVVIGRRANSRVVDEAGQQQQLVGPGRAGITADRAPGFRRHIDQVFLDACCRAFLEIKAEAQLFKHHHFETQHQFAGGQRIVKMFDDEPQCLIEAAMRIAFRQETQMGSRQLDTV